MVSPYKPLYIRGMQKGLVLNRQEFILPDDAYPILENAIIYRETIRRRPALQDLQRFRRILSTASIGNISAGGAGDVTVNVFTALGIAATEPNAEIELGIITNISIDIGAPISQTLTDTTGTGVLTIAPAGVITAASINYATGDLTMTFSGAAGASAATFSGAYYPGLPAMGLRIRELNNVNNEQTIGFDTKYAYKYSSGWQEFIPGTTWTGTNSDFFWSTNYWQTPAPANNRLFWVTNFTSGDPIRYTDGTQWVNFAPTFNAVGDSLKQCQALLPFRGRLVVFNTIEVVSGSPTSYPQRIRWAAIGNPISDVSPLFPLVANTNPQAWRSDVRGQGGFLDIPTSESIISVGFVRDNLVIFCERSTWQLRYTGRSVAPFQIEKVNSELGAESTFSAIQFDTSLVGIGDKGIVECDSFKSERIDIKIPDLVYEFSNNNAGPERVQGVRDLQQKLAYWTYVFNDGGAPSYTYPNRRLVYNYENDSWGIFTDSLTCLGTFQAQTSRKWQDCKFSWSSAAFPWLDKPAGFPSIIGANQQGFVSYLGTNLDEQVTNDPTLSIQNVTGNLATTTATVITSKDHNLISGQVIKISNIPIGTPFDNLNGKIFGVQRIDADNIGLYLYNSTTGFFDIPQLDAAATYIGGGRMAIRDNFNVTSKKFNFVDQGENVQMGYVDVLMNTTDSGAITLNVYMDYNDSQPINQLYENYNPVTEQPDSFFNTIVPTSTQAGIETNKNWQRVYCPTRAAFLTIQWTLSNAQLNGIEQESQVEIDSQILWMRKAGKLLPPGV